MSCAKKWRCVPERVLGVPLSAVLDPLPANSTSLAQVGLRPDLHREVDQREHVSGSGEARSSIPFLLSILRRFLLRLIMMAQLVLFGFMAAADFRRRRRVMTFIGAVTQYVAIIRWRARGDRAKRGSGGAEGARARSEA